MSLDPEQLSIFNRLSIPEFRDWLTDNGADTPEVIRRASDETMLATMHKLRYESAEFGDDVRFASRAWLAVKGMRRFGGEPLLPEGQLPGGESNDRA